MGLILVILGFIAMILSAFGLNFPRCHLGWLGGALVVLGALILGHLSLN